MNHPLLSILLPVSITAAVWCTLFAIASVSYPARAEMPEVTKQEMYQQLNEWRKEIVKLRYTEYCASVTPPPASLIAAIQQGVEAKHPSAGEAMKWLDQVMEKYAEKGCGDA
jgi:hypothetical protein